MTFGIADGLDPPDFVPVAGSAINVRRDAARPHLLPKGFSSMSRLLSLLSLFLVVLGCTLGGCASGPNGINSTSSEPFNPNASPSVIASPGASPNPSPSSPHLIQFALSLNDQGKFDDSGAGFYVIAMNAFDEAVDVSNYDKFTDFMKYDGTYLVWYHRQTLPNNNLFNYQPVGTLNQFLSFSDDRRTMFVTFGITDPTNIFNQFLVPSAFTVAAMTTDNTGTLGRVLDTMGPGPNLNNDTLYSYFVDKTLGVTRPVPPNYPDDPLNDWISQPDLGPNYPYTNFDIKSFQVTVR